MTFSMTALLAWIADYREMLGPPAEPGIWFELSAKL